MALQPKSDGHQVASERCFGFLDRQGLRFRAQILLKEAQILRFRRRRGDPSENPTAKDPQREWPVERERAEL